MIYNWKQKERAGFMNKIISFLLRIFRLQLLRGDMADLPKLAEAEPAFVTDEHRFFIGSNAGNVEFARADHKHPGGILYSSDFSDLSEVTVYDGVYNHAAGRIEAGERGV